MGLTKPDKNIDHRKILNLTTFFKRYGMVKNVTDNSVHYIPEDIVTWDLGGGIAHIGIVINKKSNDNQRFLIAHNIGKGQEISDCLFDFKITGHHTYKK